MSCCPQHETKLIGSQNEIKAVANRIIQRDRQKKEEEKKKQEKQKKEWEEFSRTYTRMKTSRPRPQKTYVSPDVYEKAVKKVDNLNKKLDNLDEKLDIAKMKLKLMRPIHQKKETGMERQDSAAGDIGGQSSAGAGKQREESDQVLSGAKIASESEDVSTSESEDTSTSEDENEVEALSPSPPIKKRKL